MNYHVAKNGAQLGLLSDADIMDRMARGELSVASTGVDDETTAEGLGALVGLLVSWLYYAFMESSSSQATLGKMALGIVVTDLNGERISFGRATGRYFGQIVSAITLCIGFLMCAWTEKGQCLHDMMAGCLLYKKS